MIGRDPRTITADEYRAELDDITLGMKAIRAKCIDCAHTAVEVRKCVQTSCPLWPLRMGRASDDLRAAGGYQTKRYREANTEDAS